MLLMQQCVIYAQKQMAACKFSLIFYGEPKHSQHLDSRYLRHSKIIKKSYMYCINTVNMEYIGTNSAHIRTTGLLLWSE